MLAMQTHSHDDAKKVDSNREHIPLMWFYSLVAVLLVNAARVRTYFCKDRTPKNDDFKQAMECLKHRKTPLAMVVVP